MRKYENFLLCVLPLHFSLSQSRGWKNEAFTLEVLILDTTTNRCIYYATCNCDRSRANPTEPVPTPVFLL